MAPCILVKFMYVTICDLHGHRRSQVMMQNESLYEFLSMNNCNYRPMWHRYRDIACQYFCNHGNRI